MNCVFYSSTGRFPVGIVKRPAYTNTKPVHMAVASEYTGHMEHIR
jgi:hypothetical protein